MLLCRVARKYWRFYSPTYAKVKELSVCADCGGDKKTKVEVDHFPALGKRPRTIEEFPSWWGRLMNGPQQGLCKNHHLEKTKRERKRRKLS